MRMFLLATLVLAPGFEGASLGIGIDVFDRAYGFAASRVGAEPYLGLVKCSEVRCQWSLGDGVSVTADHPAESLDVNRIEVTLNPRQADPKQASGAGLQRLYEEACLTVVALVDPGASATARRQVALAIASPGGVEARRIRIDRPDKDVSVYGTRSSAVGGANAPISRCGAVARLD